MILPKTISLNSVSYEVKDLNDEAKNLLKSIIISEEKLQKLQQELSIVKTAKNAYERSLALTLQENKKPSTPAKTKSKK